MLVALLHAHLNHLLGLGALTLLWLREARLDKGQPISEAVVTSRMLDCMVSICLSSGLVWCQTLVWTWRPGPGPGLPSSWSRARSSCSCSSASCSRTAMSPLSSCSASAAWRPPPRVRRLGGAVPGDGRQHEGLAEEGPRPLDPESALGPRLQRGEIIFCCSFVPVLSVLSCLVIGG